MRNWRFISLGLALGFGHGQGWAAEPAAVPADGPTSGRPCIVQPLPAPYGIPPCPYPSLPAPPATPAPSALPPPEPPATTTPSPTPTPPEPLPSLSPESGLAFGGSTVAVNMYGDAFGGRSVPVTITRPPIIIPGMPSMPPMTIQVGGTFLNGANPAQFTYTVPNPGFNSPPQQLTYMTSATSIVLPSPAGPIPITPPFTHTSQQMYQIDGRGGGNVPNQVPLNPVSNVTASVQAQYPGSRVVLTNGPTANLLQGNPNLPANNFTDFPGSVWTISTLYNVTTPGTPGTPPQVIPQAPISFRVPLPAGGGAVGRTKISDDNSPLPRDRVIFDFDYFDNVPLANGLGVYRFSPGFEKTFFDQRASVEVRVPFASTLNSNEVVGLTSDRAELGDVNLTLKALVYQSDVLNVAAGLAFAFPSAPGVKASLANGTPLVHIRNGSNILTPYVAYLATPTDCWFLQNWFEFGFDVSGSQVAANPDLDGLRSVGRLRDQALLQIDTQIGYWLVRSQDANRWLQGLAAFLELHYNSALDNAPSLRAGNFLIGGESDRFDELNLSTGLTAHVGESGLVNIGAVFPLRGGNDRSFDYQLGIHANWLFGVRDRGPSRAATVSAF